MRFVNFSRPNRALIPCGKWTSSLACYFDLIVTTNPYKSPTTQIAESDFGEDDSAIVIVPSFFTKTLMTVEACVYLTGSIYLLCLVATMGVKNEWSQTFLPLIFSLGCLYACHVLICVHWDRQVLESNGIQLVHMKREYILWNEIHSWKQKSENSCVLIETRDGRKRYLNNTGSRRDNKTIAEFVESKIGPKLDS